MGRIAARIVAIATMPPLGLTLHRKLDSALHWRRILTAQARRVIVRWTLRVVRPLRGACSKGAGDVSKADLGFSLDLPGYA